MLRELAPLLAEEGNDPVPRGEFRPPQLPCPTQRPASLDDEAGRGAFGPISNDLQAAEVRTRSQAPFEQFGQ
jgi:hypothetical protein